MILSAGIALSLDYRSTRRLLPAIEFIPKTTNWLRALKMCAGGVRRLAYEAADTGLLSPELAARIRRVKYPTLHKLVW
jgi:hypothetical protein